MATIKSTSTSASSILTAAGAAAAKSTTVGDSTATATTASTNPIGTTTAKLLTGDTQAEDTSLQQLKYDAYNVSLAQTALTTATASGTTSDISTATTSLDTALSTYTSDLTLASQDPALTAARMNRYLTGGANPVPENADIVDADGDISDFIDSMTALESGNATTSTATGTTATGTTATDTTATGTTATGTTATGTTATGTTATGTTDTDDTDVTDSTSSTGTAATGTTATGTTATGTDTDTDTDTDATGTTSATSLVDSTASTDYTTLSSQYEALQKQAYSTQDVSVAAQTAFAATVDDYISTHVTDPTEATTIKGQADTILSSMMASVTLQQSAGTLSNDTWDQDRVQMEALLTQIAPAGAAAVYSPVASTDTSSTASTASGTTADSSSGTTADSSSGTTADASSSTATSTSTTLTSAQLAELNDSSAVLSTAATAGVTSGAVANFSLYPDSTGEPVAADINMQSDKDCYYLSALSSMASTTAGQATIKNAISGPDSSGDYTVKMYDPDNNPVSIKVNPDNLAVLDDGSGKAAFNQGSDVDGSANWANLMEAAYAKYNDVYKTNTDTANAALTGYDAIQEDDASDTSFMQALTGQAASAYTTTGQSATTVASAISAGLTAGTPVTAYNLGTSNNTDSSGNTFIAGHAYAVTGISSDGTKVTVRNPWGKDDSSITGSATGSITMSMTEFLKQFGQINL